MNAHLAEISRAVDPGAHAVQILDGAGWHVAADLVVPDNFTLLTLPSHAPELNPCMDGSCGSRISIGLGELVGCGHVYGV